MKTEPHDDRAGAWRAASGVKQEVRSGVFGGLNKLLRGTRALPEFPAEVRRPGIFTLLFWSVLGITYLSYVLFDFGPTTDGWGMVPTTLAAVFLVVVWMALPWSPRAGAGRKLLVPAFLVGTFAVGYTSASIWALGLYAISFAGGVFVFGFRWGVAYAGTVLAVIFANYYLAFGLSTGVRLGLQDSLLLTAFWIPVAVFIIGTCAAIVEATRRREQTESLLRELGAAHAELERHAASVRELAVSEERTRMAREIHDSLGHYLTVVNVQLQAASRTMDTKPAAAREAVHRAKDLASEALSEVRRSVKALKPLDLQERSGPGAFAALARSFRGMGPDVSFEIEGNERRLSPAAELALYRTLQEGLTNALRHSRAGRVRACLTFEDGAVSLAVTDDGRGMDRNERWGFGLRALRERVEALGGALGARNAPGGGFVLEARLPLEEP